MVFFGGICFRIKASLGLPRCALTLAFLMRATQLCSLLQKRSIANIVPVKLANAVYGDFRKDVKHPPLFICHGLFGQKSNWNSVAKAIQRKLGNVVVGLDLRNHGDSPHCSSMSYQEQAADVKSLIETMLNESPFKKANLLGHSMGGKTAMRLAIDPEGAHLIEKLIIEDISPRGYSMSSHLFRDYVDVMLSANLSETRAQISSQLAGVVPDMAVRQFLLTNLASKPEGGFTWKPNLKSIREHFEELLGCSLPIGSFRGKTLFVYGGTSGYVRSEDIPVIKSLFPQVIFHEIPQCGHWVHAEKPKDFIDCVCNFLCS